VVLEKKKREKTAADLCQHWEEKNGKKICHGPYVIPSATKIKCFVFFAPVEPGSLALLPLQNSTSQTF
jgi:hypothetical protein